MSFILEDAFHELLCMEMSGLIGDEDASLQMLMVYFGL
jgi:hypothetical protein